MGESKTSGLTDLSCAAEAETEARELHGGAVACTSGAVTCTVRKSLVQVLLGSEIVWFRKFVVYKNRHALAENRRDLGVMGPVFCRACGGDNHLALWTLNRSSRSCLSLG